MTVEPLFPTLLYRDELADAAFLDELERSCRALAADDTAGRRWSRDHGYRGYTSYASLDDLPARDPAFADLRRRLDRHVARFVEACGFQLHRRLKLDSLWANVMKPGGVHSAHLHPHSVVSGTVYVRVPEGAGALRIEDPRLGLMMAAPTRPGTFHTVQPADGTLLLWESFLRHEVVENRAKGERISISFNYA